MIMARGGVPLLIRSGRNPFEVWMLSACLASGVFGLIQPQSTSGAITAALPHWEEIAWYAGLTAGGLMGLIGVFSRGVNSLLIERVGVAMLTCLTLAYAIAVIAQAGLKGILPAAFTGLFALACATRCVYITTDLKRMETIAARNVDGDA